MRAGFDAIICQRDGPMRYILRFMFVAGITATAACQEAPPAVTPGSPDDAAAFPALDARTRISPSRGSVAISDRRDGWARDGHEVNAVSIAGDTLTNVRKNTLCVSMRVVSVGFQSRGRAFRMSGKPRVTGCVVLHDILPIRTYTF